MSAPALDLSGLSQFRASDLLAAADDRPDRGAPTAIAVELIDYDPSQPRRTFKEESIEELGVSIRTHGVLEPVSLRTHPQLPGRYVVNRGERRVRAARKAGLLKVPAFIDERVDPFAQAAENLHREDMSPFDLAAFVCAREKEGLSKSEIARRLAKPRTYISEAAALIDAPEMIRNAVESGRLGSDVRTLNRLVAAARGFPERVEDLLAGDTPINRASIDALLGEAPRVPSPVASPTPDIVQSPRVVSGGRTVLVIEHGGRRGSLRLKAQDSDVGEVRFGDGTRSVLPLAELRPVCWATEELS
ncbi:ParB/RepB/Spo0J family partition protein [Variovorax sp. LjRoot84]|uniref:ParB/RepB/Spo0J family partition protein n=1 Tax=unclassified Variovorax TaxID=663243 RepID=UPI003ECE433C